MDAVAVSGRFIHEGRPKCLEVRRKGDGSGQAAPVMTINVDHGKRGFGLKVRVTVEVQRFLPGEMQFVLVIGKEPKGLPV